MRQRHPASTALLFLTGVVTLALGAACDGSTPKQPPPFTAQFQLATSGATSVFMYEGCVPELTITQVSPTRRNVTPTAACACSCDDSSCQGPVACGACAAQAREIASASPYAYTWTAVTIQSETRGSWDCVRATNLPAGDYIIQVPTYATAAEAEAHTGARNVSASFSLPAAAPIPIDLTAP